MEYCETNSGSRFRVVLSYEELQLPAIDDLCNKYCDWLRLSKESADGRKTRSANRRVDQIFDEIMAFKLPPIKLKPTTPIKAIQLQEQRPQNHSNSSKSSVDGDSESSTVSASSSHNNTRTLRPRSRTPSVSRQQTQKANTPSTPTQQSLRAHLKNNSVLSAALNQQHPSLSVTKLRQVMRADSAQKKRDEEKERQERLRQERKAKEAKAEAQRQKLMEERAINAKLNREQRLLRAAEVREARTKAQAAKKLRGDQMRKANIQAPNHHETEEHAKQECQVTKESSKESPKEPVVPEEKPGQEIQQKLPIVKPKLDETFKKPENDNIDISVHDETMDEQKSRNLIASWAKAPHLREALIHQYSKPEAELLRQAYEIFQAVKLPVDLDEIFGPSKSVNNRYLCRTSSAVWSPPHRALKRTSSMVMTPTDPKR